jgi:radical SAM protein with 4Fe4S-binding SPASM domain
MIPDYFEKKLQENYIIYSGSMELTWRCNFQCIHCYQYPPSLAELKTEEVKGIIAQLADMGCLYLSLTGGEPLLRDDFWEIAEYAREKTFALTLQTNGFLLTPDFADRIKDLNFLDVDLSLLGARPETHDAITGRPGSFKRVVKAIDLLRERNINTNVKATLMRQNFPEFKEIKALVENLDANLIMSPLIYPVHRGENPDSLRIDDENMRNYFCEMIPFEEIEESKERVAQRSFLICQTGRTYCCINPEGKVYPCIMLPIVVGDLRKKRLKEIWHDSPSPVLGRIRSMSVSDLEDCANCDIAAKCNRCSALSYLEAGDMSFPAQESCRTARILEEVISPWRKKENTASPR